MSSLTSIDMRMLIAMNKCADANNGYLVQSSALYPLLPKMSHLDAALNISRLVKLGYVSGFTSLGDEFWCYLTANGRHWTRIRFAAFRDFVMKSIVTPVIVSAITALITLWLKGLL